MSNRDCSPDDRPNWVDETDSCRPERLFEDLIEAVELDIAAMQELSEEARQDCTFELQRREDFPQFCTVYRYAPDGNHRVSRGDVRFHCLEGTVSVQARGGEEFKVGAALDPETGLRVLIIDDEDFDLWQVSRRLLHSLFFGT